MEMAQRLTRDRFVEVIEDIVRQQPRPTALAVELMRRLAGRQIPRPASRFHVERDTRIRAAIDRGEDAVAIADRERVSVRHVWRLAKREY